MITQYTTKIQVSRLKPLVAAISLLAIAGHASAVGVGTVAGGAATINTNGATTTINQSTDRAVVNWNNFDIGAGQSVKINQPTAQSAILNRVNSASKTQIDGVLNANGRVFVVNPNGVVVGKTGSINANGVVLSTLDVSNANFTQSPTYLSFRKVAGATAGASVVNDGTITAGAAGVSLFGSQVINGTTGNIAANGNPNTAYGSGWTAVNLIASNSVDTISTPSGGDFINNYGGIGNWNSLVSNGLVANDGAIKVGTGDVTLSIAGGPGVVNDVIRNTGSIRASDGAVTIQNWGNNGKTQIGGTISGSTVGIGSATDTVIDGTINADSIIIASYDIYGSSSKGVNLVVADNANLQSTGYVNLTGDNVAVTGHVTAGTTAEVLGFKQASVQQGELNAPYWTINDGGKVTTNRDK